MCTDAETGGVLPWTDWKLCVYRWVQDTSGPRRACTLASAFCSQRCVCFWIQVTDDKQSSSLEGDSLSAHSPFRSGETRRFVLSLCFLEWAATCALFRKERNTTNCCTKFPRWVQVCLRVATKQIGFVFFWDGKWFLACLISVFQVHFGIVGQACCLGTFYLRFGWQFSVFSPLPLQMTSCGILLAFLCICCQDVCQVRGAALRSRTVIFWETSLVWGSCWHLKNQLYHCLHKYWELIGLWSQLFWIDRKSFLPNLVSQRKLFD